MPQMMPLNWLTLFLYTVIIFMMFNILNYYNFNYPIMSSKTEKFKTNYNWKW